MQKQNGTSWKGHRFKTVWQGTHCRIQRIDHVLHTGGILLFALPAPKGFVRGIVGDCDGIGFVVSDDVTVRLIAFSVCTFPTKGVVLLVGSAFGDAFVFCLPETLVLILLASTCAQHEGKGWNGIFHWQTTTRRQTPTLGNANSCLMQVCTLPSNASSHTNHTGWAQYQLVQHSPCPCTVSCRWGRESVRFRCWALRKSRNHTQCRHCCSRRRSFRRLLSGCQTGTFRLRRFLPGLSCNMGITWVMSTARPDIRCWNNYNYSTHTQRKRKWWHSKHLIMKHLSHGISSHPTYSLPTHPKFPWIIDKQVPWQPWLIKLRVGQ